MEAVSWTRVWSALLLLLTTRADASGGLIRPQNVTLQTLNTQYVLLWDWPQRTAGDQSVSFSAQYMAEFKSRRAARKQNWTTVCQNVLERRCDFTGAELLYWGIYLLRVRANTSQRSSDWSQIRFCPDKHADLGPPSSVKLSSVKGDLEVVITDPLSSANESMKTLVDKMYYQIQYWRRSKDAQEAASLPTENNMVMLTDLDRWVWYCVRVQSRYDFYNKTSVFSDTHCVQTEGQTPIWQILLYFLLSLVLCFLLVLLLVFGSYKTFKTLKGIFHPSIQLPAHLQELWWSDAEMPQLLAPESPESVCEQLEVSSAPVTVPSPAADHQDSSTPSPHGSRDSGVYSTEESSDQRQQRSDVRLEDVLKTRTTHRGQLHDGTLFA